MVSQVSPGTAVELEVYSRMWHVWQVFAGRFREADQSVGEIGEFLNAGAIASASKAVAWCDRMGKRIARD
jgi:hypothetical protein